MNKKTQTKLSSFMTKILRHSPHEYGILLDEQGACEVSDLLVAVKAQDYWKDVTEEDMKQIVNTCEKQRFALEGSKIRARYGHSFKKIAYEQKTPPAVLIHGTNTRVVNTILVEGLKPMGRQYVHLSEGEHFATLAGKRRGEVVLLDIDTKAAAEKGTTFFYAGNEVWLAEYIPPDVLTYHKEM